MRSSVLLLLTVSVACFVSGGLSAHVLGGSCSMGPMFWCSRLSTAQECNAVEHCVPLWRQRGSLLSGRRREPSVMCHMSEVVVLAIKSSLQGDVALEKLLTSAPEACDTLTRMSAGFATMCKNLTRDNLMTVVVLLKHGVSPKVISELMGHCDTAAAKSISVDELLHVKRHHKRQPINSIPATRTFRPRVEGKMQTLKYRKPVDISSIDCSLCVRVISYMDKALEANKTEEEIEKALEKVCQFLPGSMRQACDSVIEKYTPLLISMFVADFPPAKICQMLGMCPKAHLPVPFTPKPKVPKSIVPHSNGVQCSICVRVMSYVDTMLEEESTVEEIEHALGTVCNFVPIPRAECDNFIKQYTPLLIHLIVSELTPVQICQVIGMCPTFQVEKPLKKENSVECDFCVHVMNYIDGFLEKNSTKQEIETVLEKVCGYLPGPVRTECDALIEQFTPVLIELLVAEFTPREICHAIGLCPAQMSLKKPVQKSCFKKQNVNAGLQCTFCVQVFRYVDHFLTENSTEVEIEQALERVCHFLPTHVQSQCNALIEQYTPVLIHLIVADFTPQEICHALGLCDNSRLSNSHRQPITRRQHRPLPQMQKPIQKQRNSLECTMCVHMMNYVDSFLQKNSTLQEIERAIEQVCAYLPKGVETECHAIVEEFTPDLVHLIVAEFTPIQICKAIEMCPQKMYKKVRRFSDFVAMPRQHRIRRPRVCQRGPRHWCKSVEIAKSCGIHAMLVCHKMVWKN